MIYNNDRAFALTDWSPKRLSLLDLSGWGRQYGRSRNRASAALLRRL